MGLNLGGGGGTAKSYLKYNAKAGRWSFRNLDGTESELSDPTFIADLENIATGWMLFVEGLPPDRVMDPSTETPAPKPSDKHKRGFILSVYSKNLFGGVAEISGTSMVLANVVKALYQQFEEQRGANAGKVPVVAAKGTTAQKSKFGTNYAPNMTIVKWVDRPDELPSESPAHPNDVYQGSTAAPAASKPAGHVPPPAPKAVSSPATEF